MRTGTGASSKRRSCSMLNEVVELVAADLRQNPVDSDQLTLLIETVRQPLVGLGQSHVGPQPPIPAVPARRRIAADAPIRLKCGAIVRTLRRHLLTVDNSRPGDLWDENGTHRASIRLQHPITFSCARACNGIRTGRPHLTPSVISLCQTLEPPTLRWKAELCRSAAAVPNLRNWRHRPDAT